MVDGVTTTRLQGETREGVRQRGRGSRQAGRQAGRASVCEGEGGAGGGETERERREEMSGNHVEGVPDAKTRKLGSKPALQTFFGRGSRHTW